MRSNRTIPTPRPPRITPPEVLRPRGVVAACLAAVALTGSLLSGCGYTSSPAMLPPQLKTVAIPTFVNGTTEVGLDQEITQAVIDAFVKDNHLRVVDDKSPNLLLAGKPIAYKD